MELDPSGDLAGIVSDCVHCGFCLTSCPTYQLWGEEMDSPRGRIHLISQLLNGANASEAAAVHLDRCLGCMACVPACPSGVRYDRLIEEARSWANEPAQALPPRSRRERALRAAIFATFPYPSRLRALMGPLHAAQRTRLDRLLERSGIADRLAPELAAALRVAPGRPARRVPRGRLPDRVPARGERRAVVGMLTGCVQQVFFGPVNVATARVLAAEGCDVVIPRDQGCCGALSLHDGRRAEAARFAANLIETFDPRLIRDIANSMLKRLAEPFEINDQILHLAGSAGIAIAPNDGATIDELMANADLALYDAKSVGGRVLRFFLPVLRADAQARRGLDVELRRAFEQDEFELYFQPQVRLADGAVVGAEALLRWRHSVRGILAPGVFIEALAENPIAHEVERWIVRTACRKASDWRSRGLPLSRIGVNLFPLQSEDDAVPDVIESALEETGLPADVIELEITENVALDYANAIVRLQQLHSKGVRLALDDFGTGYASLNCLTRLPLSRIKIDRCFIGKVTEAAENTVLVRSLIGMAHDLGLEVIAEGVETDAQAAFLLNERCEEAQGFLYAKPIPADEFETYVRTKSAHLSQECWATEPNEGVRRTRAESANHASSSAA